MLPIGHLLNVKSTLEEKTINFVNIYSPPHTITHTQNQQTVRLHNQNRPMEQDLYTFPNKDYMHYIPFTTDADKTIFADGSYKMLFGINGHYPGPSVVVYEGQQVIY